MNLPVLLISPLKNLLVLLLSLLMIMGRLEILVMLALFVPALWRRY